MVHCDRSFSTIYWDGSFSWFKNFILFIHLLHINLLQSVDLT